MSSSWTDRIKNWETDPPENGWDKIAASLDESLNGQEFPRSVYNMETQPPASAWDKIRQSLDGEETPVVPLTKKSTLPSVLRYAVAAAIIGLLAVGAVRYFNINTGKLEVAAGPGIKSSRADTPVGSPKQESSLPNPPQQTTTDSETLSTEPPKDSYASLDLHSHSFTSRVSRALYRSPVALTDNESSIVFGKNAELQYPHRAAVNDNPSDNAMDRYLMFRNNQGQFIRISKKLTDLFCCVSGEEQDDHCNDQLKKWREKIASSSFVPSPDNFMDILDLVNSLEDNRN